MMYSVLHVIREFFFFSSRRRHTRSLCDWSSDVCSSDLFRCTAFQSRACRISKACRGRDERPAGPASGRACVDGCAEPDRKSTRLNSSHTVISYAVFCLKKKKKEQQDKKK